MEKVADMAKKNMSLLFWGYFDALVDLVFMVKINPK